VRLELGEAREKAREEVYSNMNNVGTMGAEQDGGMIQVDYHGLHVAEMRKKFKDHIVPIIAEVKMIMVITGRGSHSVGSEGKLKKALLKLIGEYENLYWQRVEGNDGAVLVLWRKKKGP
jgi:DNA-nicking Smr family endonuclease